MDIAETGVSLADWVCLVENESSFNTNALNSRNRNGSKDYGLFQINSYYWCIDGGVNTANGCNINCEELYEVDAAVSCAKRVVQDRNGIRAWMAWVDHCDRDLSNFLDGCEV
ncbi:unnamed protein product [Knipowitschia caucasica]|uniref:lysozyme n=1 Tax=Knipowitschia caucasica TaxID=637954 RepID=A0AAV2LL68_KNICA